MFDMDISSLASEVIEGLGVSPPRIMWPLRTSAPRGAQDRHRTMYDHRIDYGDSYSSVGKTVSFFKSREGRSGELG